MRKPVRLQPCLLLFLQGVALVALWLFSFQAMAMSFRVSEVCNASGCNRVVFGEGAVLRDSNEALRKIAETLPKGTTVVLSAPGGDLLGALRLGELIRQRGFDTEVSPEKAECYSACVFAFMGGVNRSVHPLASLGFHSLKDSGAGVAEEEAQRNSRRLLGVYLDQMRIDRRVLDYALTTKPGQLQTIDAGLARRLGLVSEKRVETNVNSVWQLRASRSGRLLGFIVETLPNGIGSLTLGITFLNGEYRLLTHFEPSPSVTSTMRTDLEVELAGSKGIRLMVRNEVLPVKSRYPWQKVSNGYQAWGQLTPTQIRQLQDAPEFKLNLGLAETSLLGSELVFTTVGLANIIAALGRQVSSSP